MPATRQTQPARRAQDVRRQIEALDRASSGFSWRERAQKARVMTALRSEEARLRRRARTTQSDDEQLSF